jgi:tetratricopeptide (TPR) repeat protein
MDQHQSAMQYLLKSVKKHGTDRTALGVDLILEEWIARAKKLAPDVADEAWGYLHALTAEARKQGERTLALRLLRTFLYRPGITDKAKELLVADLLKPENLPLAPIGVLEYMMDEAKAQGNMDLAIRAAEAVIAEFPETDTVLAARMLMAEQAMAKNDHDTAVMHLNIIREVFATSLEAANALMMLGEIHKQKRQYAEADKFYKDILGVKEWRGPLWPRALYERGECARFQRKFQEASAYYERIYLMYANYREWCAKAYIQRANCLVALDEREKARQTIEEMLSNKELAESKEGTEARELLKKIQGTSL